VVYLIGHHWRFSGVFESGKTCPHLRETPGASGTDWQSAPLEQIYLKVDNPNRAQEVVSDLKKATKIPRPS
jgi:hypothetical protein